MADNGQIKHTDIAEVGVMKPLQDELIATIQILNTMDADLLSIAKSLKKALSENTGNSTKALKEQTEAIRQSKEAMTLKEIQTKQLIKIQTAFAASTTDLAKETEAERLKLQESNRELKENAKLTSEQIGAYDKASIKLNQMTKAWKNLAIVQKENSVEGKALKKQIDELDSTLKRVDASTGKFNRNVGNYGGAISGVRMQFNQLSREVPSTINNLSSMFLAFSNNLPMMSDAVANLRKENEMLKASGQATTPVWKAVAGAFFSFGTALSVGITLLTVYGAEVVNGIKSMLGFTVATKEQEEAMKKHAQTIESINEEQAKNTLSIETLVDVINDENNSNKIKKQAYLDLQKLIPELTNLTYEQATSQDLLNSAVARQIRLIELKAKFEIYQDEIVSQIKTEIANQRKSDAEKIAQLAKEKLEIDERERLSAKSSAVIFTLYDRERRIAIDEEIKTLKLSSKEKAALVQAEILDIERLGTEAKNDAKKKKYVQTQDTKDRMGMYEEYIKFFEHVQKKGLDLSVQYAKLLKEKDLAENAQLIDTQKQHQDAQNKLFEIGKKNRLKAKENEAKQEADLLRSATNILQNSAKKQLEITNNKIDRELQANQRRISELRDMSQRGVQDANNNLAFEERKQAELEAKRIKAQKNAKKQEIIFAGLKAYSSNVEKNPQTALVTTLKDLTLLTSALASLPTFIEGTENIGKSLGKPQLSGKDGYVVRVDGDERVLSPSQNKVIGDMSNDELTNLANLHNKGLLSVANFGVPMSRHIVDDRLLNETSQMNKNLEDVKNLLKNIPQQTIQYDELSKISTEIIRSENRVISTSKKIGGLRG